jgi:hypothetical protein
LNAGRIQSRNIKDMKQLIFLLLFVPSCWNDIQDCDCGTINETGTNQDGERYVELTTDCESTIYLTDSVYTVGQGECKDNLSVLILTIKP